jgi:uncharacterized protein
MTNDLWLNLPVIDLARSVAFYEAIGFERNPGPGNSETSASFVVGDKRVVLMLFVQRVFAGLVGTKVADTRAGCEVLISLGASSAVVVDEIAKRARDGGGSIYGAPGPAAGGGMYSCGLCDPDGHRWNVLFMDPQGA